MLKEYLLFDISGLCFYIVNPTVFFDNITSEDLKSYYILNYYYYVLETINRTIHEIKYKKDVELMSESSYNHLKNTINLFRNSGYLSDSEITDLESTVFLSFSLPEINNFSNN